MRRKHPTLGLLTLLMLPTYTAGQPAASPDRIVTLQEGIRYYVEGRIERPGHREPSLVKAIERFSKVLDTDPDNLVAIWFRALSHGAIALEIREEKITHRGEASLFDQIRKMRSDVDLLKKLTEQVTAAQEQRKSPSEAERGIAESFLKHQKKLRNKLDKEIKNNTTLKELERRRLEELRRFYEQADRERQSYTAMLADLQRLTTLLHDPQTALRLIEVLAKANVARIDEQTAVGIEDHIIPKERATGTPALLREDVATRLEDAIQLLEQLNTQTLEPQDAVRVHFFLGVLRYRQAVPAVGEHTPRAPTDPEQRKAWLSGAERHMAALADDDGVDPAWRSYASLYLGLILPHRAVFATEPETRKEILEEAKRRLTQAAELDLLSHKPGRSYIPDLVWRQRALIDGMSISVTVARPRKDLTLSLYAGARRDTNVVLLGERTDLPRDISRTRDYSFTAGAAIDYTWDFADRWSLGLQVRTAQLWNIDVHEFDQQTYGGSVALQYELVPLQRTTGPTYLTLQYDFDYTLLGRGAFLTAQTIRPGLRTYWDEQKSRLDFTFSHEIRNYFEPLFDDRFNRDGIYLSLDAVYRVKTKEMTAVYQELGLEPWGHPGDPSFTQDDPDYPKRYLTPFIGGGYAWDATDGDEFDRKAGRLLLGVECPLPRGWLLEATATFDWETYPQGSLVDFHRRRRRDFVQEYGLSLSRTFVLNAGAVDNRYTPTFDRSIFRIEGFFNWTGDDSNVVDRLGQAIFAYDRFMYGITVLYSFN